MKSQKLAYQSCMRITRNSALRNRQKIVSTKQN